MFDEKLLIYLVKIKSFQMSKLLDVVAAKFCIGFTGVFVKSPNPDNADVRFIRSWAAALVTGGSSLLADCSSSANS